MIGAMARAGARLAEPRYLAAAERAAGFVLVAARGRARHAPPRLPRGPRPRGRLPRRLRLPGARACSQLHGATGEKRLARRGRAPRGGAGAPPRRRGGRRVLRGRRGPAPPLPGEAGLRRRGGLGQRRRRAERGRAGAPHRGPLVGRPRRGGAPGLRRRDGAGAARPRHARPGAGSASGRRPEPRLLAPRGSRAGPVPPSPAPDALEEEAYEAVEIDARLGSSDDDDWKPFRVELDVRKGWHVNANPAGPGLVATAVAGVVGGVRDAPLPGRGDLGRRRPARCRSTGGGSRSRARSSAAGAGRPASR